ncbi:hypothetical protein IF2G_09605 [Cordyceps javanica]|nr:hypothetical protein IF2G_09605 [Cordyceps javanica]
MLLVLFPCPCPFACCLVLRHGEQVGGVAQCAAQLSPSAYGEDFLCRLANLIRRLGTHLHTSGAHGHSTAHVMKATAHEPRISGSTPTGLPGDSLVVTLICGWARCARWCECVVLLRTSRLPKTCPQRVIPRIGTCS